MNLSKIIVYGTFVLFCATMTAAVTLAYTRGYSGTTGLDMAKVQKMRTSSPQSSSKTPF